MDPSSNTPTHASPDAEFPLLRLIVRWRWGFFLLLAVIQIGSFNGRWRIGRDGALYRSVAHNLAVGNGYSYRGEIERHVYPGLPLLLAGVEKTFGPQDVLRPTATLIVMMLIGVATLVVIYHLMKLYLPLWLAVCVVTGVGINRIFLMQEHDMMTDVPFLLASMTALLGLAHFQRSKTMQARALWASVLVISLIAALMIRPTFWALAAALVGASVLGMLVRSKHRLWYGAALAAIVGAAMLWFALDPRTKGSGFLSGLYEQRALTRITHLASLNWRKNLVDLCGEHFPEAMIALDLRGIGYFFTAAVFAAGILLVRRSWVWGLYVLATLCVTILMGSVPRYFLMILPLLLAGWGLTLHALAMRVKQTRYAFAAEWVLILGLTLTTVPHFIKTVGFAMEQHGISRNFKSHPFLEVYRDGKMKPVYEMAMQIRQRVPANRSVLAPEARIMTFVSGRNVYDPIEFTSRHGGINMNAGVAKLRAIKGLSYCVYGKHVHRVMQALLRSKRMVILGRRPMAKVGPMLLARMRLDPPPATQPRAVRVRPARAATKPASQRSVD